jgi:hypothetical protein
MVESMKKYIIIIIIFFMFSNCHSAPDKIAQGEWNYKLFVNGLEVGTAIISNRISDSNYISTSEYNMKLADMNTITKDIITETTDFKPVKLESYSKIENAGKVHETKIISIFKGKEVELAFGDKKYNYTVTRDFIIDGNYFMSKLIEAKFRQGYEITNYVYNPSVEAETPIKATTKVAGYEKIMINGKEFNLIHITQSIENIKDNVDLFIDNNGILQKGIISMLNLKIELIKI